MIINTTIDKLIFDDKNNNAGTELGNHLLEKSLTELGFGRAVLLDKDNRLICGNKTIENAGASGFNKVRIIETDGNEIIAVKRKDISLDSKKGRALAIADNQTAKVGINFDFEVIDILSNDFECDFAKDWCLEAPKPPKSFRLGIKCESLEQLQELQTKLDIDGKSIDYNDFIEKINSNS